MHIQNNKGGHFADHFKLVRSLCSIFLLTLLMVMLMFFLLKQLQFFFSLSCLKNYFCPFWAHPPLCYCCYYYSEPHRRPRRDGDDRHRRIASFFL